MSHGISRRGETGMAWDTAREGAIQEPSRRGRLGRWESWGGSRLGWESGKGEGKRWRVPGAGEIEDEGGRARERPRDERGDPSAREGQMGHARAAWECGPSAGCEQLAWAKQAR